MKNSQQPNRAYLCDLGKAFDRFVDLVKAENAALEQHESKRLQELTPLKVEAGKALDTLTREFLSRFKTAADEEMDAFTDLVNRAAGLRPLLERNMALLNAAKVSTANRIEAGLNAWRRSQKEKTTGYGEDGKNSQPDRTAPAQPVRLV